MKNILLTTLLLISFTGYGQVSQIAGNFSHGTECMGVEGDGTQTVKAYGNGRHRWDAIEQARKNAVRDVIFNGLREGKQECEQRPLVAEVNAREKYEKYFNTFFADEGPYKNFVSTEDERLAQRVRRDKSRGRESVSHAFIVRVLRPQLREKLIADGILKQ